MKSLLEATVLLFATASVATAQAPVYSIPGVDAGGQNGFTVTNVGDLDADGYSDIAVGSPYADVDGWIDTGRLRIYSGRTGLRMRQYRGDRDLQGVGYSVAGLGDVDGDGHDDIAIGMLVGRFRYPGEVWIASGTSGRIQFRLYGDGDSYDYFGSALAGVGDVDGDGYADIAVGAYGQDDNGNNSGRVEIYSGRSRSVIHTFVGSAANEDFGYAIGAAGDVDGDGYGDLLVGAPRYDAPGKPDAGRAFLYSGRTGALLWSAAGDAAGVRFGCSVAGAGDVDQDGRPDVVVGAHRDSGDTGLARVFSGVTGAVLYTWNGENVGDQLGFAVAGAGDVDGDGYADLLVGAPRYDATGGVDSGRGYLRSGRTGAVITAFDGASAGAQRGAAVASAGDIDGDGYSDFVIGAPFAAAGGLPVGVADVFSLGGVGTPGRTLYREAGCRGSDGRQPRIELVGRTVLGDSYDVLLRGALPNSLALLNFGLQWDLPLGGIAPGCVLYAYPLDIRSAATDADGFARSTPFVQIPVNPAFVGVELHHQWLVIDRANNALGISSSNDAVAFLGQ